MSWALLHNFRIAIAQRSHVGMDHKAGGEADKGVPSAICWRSRPEMASLGALKMSLPH